MRPKRLVVLRARPENLPENVDLAAYPLVGRVPLRLATSQF